MPGSPDENIRLIGRILTQAIFCMRRFLKTRGDWHFMLNLFQFIVTLRMFKGVISAKMVKIIKFLFFCSKSVFRYGGITSQIFRGLAALEPPKMGGKGEFVFFSFSIENEKENGKNSYVL